MNIIEETVGTYRVEITGMTIRQIKDVFEDKWGAMVWSGGAAYPSGDINLQFKKALAALDTAQPEPVNTMLVEALECMVESVTGVDQVSAVNEARAALTAAKQAQPALAKLSKFKLLAITTAYEQGVGKGKERTDFNPYSDGTDEREAWGLGYQEGEGMGKQAQPERAPLSDKFLQPNDYYLLHRFIETTEDDEGYDITKAEIKRLADLGVVQSHGFGKYSVTMFGYWVHEHYWEQNPSLPLKTNSDRNAEAAIKQGGQHD